MEEKVINGHFRQIGIYTYMSIVYNLYLGANCTEMNINQYVDVVVTIYNTIYSKIVVILFRNMKIYFFNHCVSDATIFPPNYKYYVRIDIIAMNPISHSTSCYDMYCLAIFTVLTSLSIKYYNYFNSPVFTCFLDASKAFDRVTH